MIPQDYKKLLEEFIAFKSVSTDPAFKPEMTKTIDWLEKLFKAHGFTVEIWQGTANPIVFASYGTAKAKETILVYGHYDVQPAEGWDGFKLTEKRGRLYGRGVVDNKGQVLIHIYTVFKLIAENKLGVNVKFLLEGDEETGTGDIGELVAKNKAKLKVDHVLVSDGELVGEVPTVEVSLRGGFNCTVTYKTANNNLHSGIYGSAAPNAAHELAGFVSKLENFTDLFMDTSPVTKDQLADNKKLEKLSSAMFAATGIKKFLLEKGLDFFSQTGLRPAVQVTGFKSGYISEGYANIVPATAESRINFRLVGAQNPEKIFAAFKKFVAKNTPEYVDFDIKVHGLHFPMQVDVSSKKVAEVRKLLHLSHGTPPLPRYVGGAIPVVADFKTHLGKDTLLIPLVNDDCNMHGVDENFRIDLLEKGLDFSCRFFST